MQFTIRDFRSADAAAVDALALSAFEEYSGHYSDWPAFAKSLGDNASLARHGEFILAESGERIVGAVAYIGPNNALIARDATMLLCSPCTRRAS
jgi:hypothetical protein